MKINFTKKEYRHLIDLITIGDWVINSHRTRSEDEPKHYSALIQKIYSHTKEMDCEDLIRYEKSEDGYHPTYEYDMDSQHREYIDQFEVDTMWQQLSSALADRDVLKQYGENVLADMSQDERVKLRWETEAVWAKELEEHGLSRIVVSEDTTSQ